MVRGIGNWIENYKMFRYGISHSIRLEKYYKLDQKILIIKFFRILEKRNIEHKEYKEYKKE